MNKDKKQLYKTLLKRYDCRLLLDFGLEKRDKIIYYLFVENGYGGYNSSGLVFYYKTWVNPYFDVDVIKFRPKHIFFKDTQQMREVNIDYEKHI